MVTEIHKFENAGLGKAPYRFVGCNQKWFKMPDGTAKPGSSCDYCGTGILNEFWFVSTDGNRFKVGCDCFYKASAKTKIYSEVERAERELKRNAKADRDAMVIGEAKVKFEANPEMFTNKPHPSFTGKTMRDYVEWMFRNAGTSGKLRVSKLIMKEG